MGSMDSEIFDQKGFLLECQGNKFFRILDVEEAVKTLTHGHAAD